MFHVRKRNSAIQSSARQGHAAHTWGLLSAGWSAQAGAATRQQGTARHAGGQAHAGPCATLRTLQPVGCHVVGPLVAQQPPGAPVCLSCPATRRHGLSALALVDLVRAAALSMRHQSIPLVHLLLHLEGDSYPAGHCDHGGCTPRGQAGCWSTAGGSQAAACSWRRRQGCRGADGSRWHVCTAAGGWRSRGSSDDRPDGGGPLQKTVKVPLQMVREKGGVLEPRAGVDMHGNGCAAAACQHSNAA